VHIERSRAKSPGMRWGVGAWGVGRRVGAWGVRGGGGGGVGASGGMGAFNFPGVGASGHEDMSTLKDLAVSPQANAPVYTITMPPDRLNAFTLEFSRTKKPGP
jgi:hypothetical protein